VEIIGIMIYSTAMTLYIKQLVITVVLMIINAGFIGLAFLALFGILFWGSSSPSQFSPFFVILLIAIILVPLILLIQSKQANSNNNTELALKRSKAALIYSAVPAVIFVIIFIAVTFRRPSASQEILKPPEQINRTLDDDS